jgi:tetratricopeptide (TPR) repeat protein
MPMMSVQGVDKPTITNIPGGFFVEWTAPVEVGAIQLGKGLTGKFEVLFDVPSNQLTKIIDKKPEPVSDLDMITALADYWIVRGKPERAIPLYEGCLKRGDLDESKVAVFQNNLAMLYSRALGQHEKALETINNALAQNKDHTVLLDSKGLILLNNGDAAAAIPVLTRAVELSCQLPVYCMHLAYALHQEGKDPQARRYLDSVRPQLSELAPTMTKENKAMYDTLLSALPPVQ